MNDNPRSPIESRPPLGWFKRLLLALAVLALILGPALYIVYAD